MKRIVLAALVLAAGCAKKQDKPAPSGDRPPVMSAAEAKRSQDACTAYAQRACACADTVPAAKASCDAARALPEAVRIGLEVATNPDTEREDVISAQRSVRKTVKSCIEDTAKLADLGCK